ncbi:MAG: hypothetical protein A4S09_04920 [Proteobacteria bacterium SG_bin7]|nr:MAG: hypothetical protein A4S09_04920 [Proteobacteria bacterium SG_bin7]
MKTVVLLILFYGLQVLANDDCKHDDKNFRCVKVTKIYDGDTITVDLPNVAPVFGKSLGVRIRGIDTAEIRGGSDCEKQSARTARKLVESMVRNAKRVDLLSVDRDKYFRLLANVKVDGKDLKETLLKNNLAVHYDGGTKQKVDWCKRLPASSEGLLDGN